MSSVHIEAEHYPLPSKTGIRAIFQHDNDSKHIFNMTVALLKKLRLLEIKKEIKSQNLIPDNETSLFLHICAQHVLYSMYLFSAVMLFFSVAARHKLLNRLWSWKNISILLTWRIWSNTGTLILRNFLLQSDSSFSKWGELLSARNTCHSAVNALFAQVNP